MDKNSIRLIDTVIKGDYCVGCGVCASLKNSPFEMQLDEYGTYKPVTRKSVTNEKMDINVLAVCPFSNEGKNENELGKELYTNANFNQYTGYYLKNYAGYVKEGDFREKGSSGGMGTWIAHSLLKENLVDAIIHVKSNEEQRDKLFEYTISFKENDLATRSKSRYYPVEMSEILKFIKENPMRYAIVGIPCFIKSVRLLANNDNEIKERVKFCISLVCGHLKSDFFAKAIGWELGVNPDNLIGIDFRKKLSDRVASDYAVEVIGEKDGSRVVNSKPTKDLYSTNWGHGLFKYNACEYCDDVLGETADVTVGDAWLPEYIQDSQGTNIIIVRNSEILKMIENNKEKVHVEEISVEKIYKSQSSGFRHRREGLSYRLYLKDVKGEWRPQKRTHASNKLSSKRKSIYQKRILLSQKSFESYRVAVSKQDFNVIVKDLKPLMNELDKVTAPSKLREVLSKTKRKVLEHIKN